MWSHGGCSGTTPPDLQAGPSRIVRHNDTNDITAQYPQPAFRPLRNVPAWLDWLVKRPDGFALVPWQGGNAVIWDITVVSTLAQSYFHVSGHICSWRRRTYHLMHGRRSNIHVTTALETLGGNIIIIIVIIILIIIINILCYAPSVFTCIVRGAIQMTVYIYIYICNRLTDWLKFFIMTSDKLQMKLQCMIDTVCPIK